MSKSTSIPKLTPLFDRVLVKRFEVQDKTASGIYIPDSAKEKPSEGEVLSVGGGKVSDSGTVVAPTVKVGDRVLFSKYAGTEVSFDGEKLVIMREDDIFGILN